MSAHAPIAAQPAESSASPQRPAQDRNAFDTATIALCVQALQQFRAGLSQALLYTLETRQFEKSAESAYTALRAVLDKLGPFTLALSKNNAIFNGTRVEIPASTRIIVEYVDKMMNAAGLSSLKFDKELTVAETGLFLQLLSRKKFGSQDGAKINAFLREQQIAHIQTGELRYVAIGAQEKVVASALTGLANHSMAQTAVNDVTDAFRQTVERVADVEARRQLRAEVVDQLIQKDTEMLGNILATASQRLKDPSFSGLRDLVALAPRDSALINQALELGRVLLAGNPDENDPGSQGIMALESLKALKALIEQLAGPYKSRAEELLGALKLEAPLLPLLPEWLVNAANAMQDGSALERLDGILTQSPQALLDEAMFQQIVDVLDELSVAGLDEEAQRLAAHVAGALQSVTKAGRMAAVTRLSGLLDRSMEQVSEAAMSLENALLHACTHETCDEVMRLLLEHLARRCTHHYSLGNFDRASEHLDWIASLEESSRLAMRADGANLARLKREELGRSEFGQTVAMHMAEPDPQGAAARHMAMVLGPAVWSALLQRIREEPDLQAALGLAAQLRQFGGEAVRMFFSTITREASGAAAIRLFSIAPALGDEAELWAAVPPLLKHADPAVRAHVFDFLVRFDSARSVQVLLDGIHGETGIEQKLHYLRVLAGLRDAAVLPALLSLLNGARGAAEPSEEIMACLLEAIAAFDHPDIVAAASPLLTPGRTRGNDGIETALASSKPVALAAIKALARYYTHPLVAEAFERARREKDAEIARLALVSLRGIVAAEKQQSEAQAQADAAAAAPPPATSSSVRNTAVLRKAKRFEILEAQGAADNVFRIGATVGGTQHSAPPAHSEPPAHAEPRTQPVAPAAAQMPKPAPALAGMSPEQQQMPLPPAPQEAPRRAGSSAAIPLQPFPQIPQRSASSPALAATSGPPSSAALPSRPPTPSPFAAPPAVTSSGMLRMASSASSASSQLLDATAADGSGAQLSARSHPGLKGLKPSLEGLLQDVGLFMALNMLCKADGVMRIQSKGIEGRIYIRMKKIVHAAFAGKTGLEALSELEQQKNASFEYFQKISAPDMPLNIEASALAAAIEKYRDEQADKSYY